MMIGTKELRNLVETLVIIEGIALLGNEVHDNDTKTLKLYFDDVYRLSHSSTGHCEGCKHPNVVKQDAETRRKAKEYLTEFGIVDVDKAVEEILQKISG